MCWEMFLRSDSLTDVVWRVRIAGWIICNDDDSSHTKKNYGSWVFGIIKSLDWIDIKVIRLYYMRLFPSSRRRLHALPQTRKELQINMREFIKNVGPALGEIYYGKCRQTSAPGETELEDTRAALPVAWIFHQAQSRIPPPRPSEEESETGTRAWRRRGNESVAGDEEIARATEKLGSAWYCSPQE
jgi:hypothetical protein